MKTGIVSIPRATLCAAVWLLFRTSSIGADYETNVQKSFTVSGQGQLTVEADRGSIIVATEDTQKVQVEVLRRVKGGSRADADQLFANHEVTLVQDGNKISVTAKNKKNGLLSRGPYLEVRYEIRLPKKFHVDLKTAGGEIAVGDLDGNATARTSSGAIKLGSIAGKIDAADAGGSIQIESAGESVAARTSSGSITVRKAGGKVEARNAGGAITIDSAGGDVDAATSSGSIKIGGAAGNITVKNAGGSISIGDAGKNVIAATSSGSIRIKNARGEVDTKNAGGDIVIDQVDGKASIRTSSGKIQIGRAKSQVDATVAGGNIDVGDARGAVVARGSSGHIHVNFSNVPKSESRLEVAGGGIKVGLPKNAALDVDARASGGKVSSDMPVATLSSGRTGNHEVLEGKLNGGGPALVLRSSSGDIRITESPAVQAEAEK